MNPGKKRRGVGGGRERERGRVGRNKEEGEPKAKVREWEWAECGGKSRRVGAADREGELGGREGTGVENAEKKSERGRGGKNG